MGFCGANLPHLTMRNFLHENPTASKDGDGKWMTKESCSPIVVFEAWLASGATDHAVGEDLTFVGSAKAAREGKASWFLRFRAQGRSREKVLGRAQPLDRTESGSGLRTRRCRRPEVPRERALSVDENRLPFACQGLLRSVDKTRACMFAEP